VKVSQYSSPKKKKKQSPPMKSTLQESIPIAQSPPAYNPT
jgi:hypothetical protein